MSETLYPKTPRQRRAHPERRWHVRYEHMAYDNGTSSWTGYHHTRISARLAAWWHQNITSWGGFVTMTDKREQS